MIRKGAQQFSMLKYELKREHGALVGRPRIRMAAVQPLSHFLSGLEERNALLIDRNMSARAWIAPCTSWAMLDREGTEATQLDAITACEGRYDLFENRIHNVLDIPLVQMRVVLGDTLNKFGFDHREIGPGSVRMTISVKIP